MLIQRPTYIDVARFDPGLGEAEKRCGILVPAIIGAIAFYAIPPFLAGFFNTARDEWRNR